MNRHAAPTSRPRRSSAAWRTDQRHDSAHKHVAGAGRLYRRHAGAGRHAAWLPRPRHASRMARSARSTCRRCAPPPGVVDVLTAKDVPGENDISPTGRHDEPVLADGKVEFFGQPIFCVIAETRERRGAPAGWPRSSYEELPAIIDVAGLDPVKGKLVTPPLTLKRGDAAAAIAAAPRRLKGQMRVGGQDHFYLEGHIAHGRARRGPGRHRLFLDPASERSAAHGGACARRSVACGDRRDPAHGRRLRRQGDAGQPVRRAWPRSPPSGSAARSRSGPTATTT